LFYEYALLPDIFEPTLLYCDVQAELVVTELLRGIAHNGMVASLHKGKWRKYVGELLTQIPSEAPGVRRKSPRERIQSCLEMLDARNRVVRHPISPNGDPASNKDWLDIAIRSHNSICFDGLVMCQELYTTASMNQCQQAVALDDALSAGFWTGRSHDVTVQKTRTEFSAALAPILRHAKKVTLIDPHFDPLRRRWRNIVEIVQRLTGDRGKLSAAGWNAEIHIHAGDPQKSHRPQSPRDRLDTWQRALARLPRRFRIKISLWSKDISGPDLHDRYIITNQCGVSCPGGLDCYDDLSMSSKAQTTSTWFLMSHDAMSAHLGEYEENSSPYDLLGSREFALSTVP
jgi:hypothetical protein